MDRRTRRARVPGDDPLDLLAAARRLWAFARPAAWLSATLDTTDSALLRALAPHPGETPCSLVLETTAPRALLRALPPWLDLRVEQAGAGLDPATTIEESSATLVTSWGELARRFAQGGVLVPVARDRIVERLTARLAALSAARVLRDAVVDPQAWVRGLLEAAAGAGVTDSHVRYGDAWQAVHPGPPAVPVSVTALLRTGVAADVAALEGIFHTHAPVRVATTVRGMDFGGLALPPGALRSVRLPRDPGPALDALFAAAMRDPAGAEFSLYGECEHWEGQDDYFTASSGLLLQRANAAGTYELRVQTELRYPASAAVTDAVRAEWNADAAATEERIADAAGVLLGPVE